MAKNPFAGYGNPFKKKDEGNPFAGKETMDEEEKEHGVKLDAPLEAHKGEETPEEEEAEEEEIEEKGLRDEEGGGMTPRLFVDEVKALLEKLDAPAAKKPKQWSINESKFPL